MSAVAIAMGLQAGGTLLQGGTQLGFGIADRRRAKRLEEEAGERPEYQIPESVDQMIAMYRQMAQGGMPGEDMARQDIQASTARTATTAGQLADSPIAALTALGGAQQRELGALRDLQMRATQYRSQMQQGYAGAVGQRANYEQEEWRQNQLLPWEIPMNQAMSLRTAGAGNIMGAADSAGAGMAQMGSFYATNDIYNRMYPNVNQPSATNAATQYGTPQYGWGGAPYSSGLGIGGSYVPPWHGG